LRSPTTAAEQQTPPDDVIELWDIDEPRDSDANARVHPKDQIEELRGSLREYGQVWPILVREDGEIIAGHGRRQAAKLEGMKQIKVLVARGWSEARCRAFSLLDNQVPLNATWDSAKLALEVQRVKDDGGDPLKLGFSNADMKRLMLPGAGLGSDGKPPVEFKPVYQVLIECTDELEQREVLTKLQQDGISCRALIA
jgi:ParB-like chromosome segregation protein Spo0J